MNKKNIVLSLIIASFSYGVCASNVQTDERIIFANEIWEKNQSNPLSQFYIAEQHFIKENYNEALTWYLRSAMQGFEPAVVNAQILIKQDLGTSNNMKEIVDFLTNEGLKKNNLFAQLYLGDVYRNGKFETNYEKSFFWYSEASKQGDIRASFYVGNMTAVGLGTIQNVPRAIRILETVAEKDHTGAIYNIGKIYKMGYNVQQNHKLATEWLKKGAHLGNVDAMFEYGDSIERGLGIERNHKEAIYWFENAALQGHNESAYRAGLANLFLSVLGEKEFTVENGLRWLNIAAENGSIDAEIRLGDIYYEGRHGIPKNFLLAEKYYTSAANKNEQIAYRKLSFLYRTGGHGVERNDKLYKQNMEKYYSYKKPTVTIQSDRLNLFNYSVFKF